MNNTKNETRGNPKLVWAFGGLAVALAALTYATDNVQKPQRTTDNKTPSYLKNCALKTALERPRD